MHRAVQVIILGAMLTAIHAAAVGAAPDTTVTVRPGEVYYELPRGCVGGKLTAYASDYAGGSAPSDPQRARRTTADGKTWIDCVKELKLGFVGASMVHQGRPPGKGTPDPHYDDWRATADAVVAAGGGIMIEYMAGVRGMPQGTTLRPEDPANIDPDPGPWSVRNGLDWADFMAARHGADKIRLAEFYNEPATMNDHQLGSRGCWYAYKDFKNADRLCADWATNHQQDYYKAFKAKYPHAVICGASYSSPAGLYNAGEGRRYLQGYPGARVSAQDPNTHYQDALSLHCYGFKAGAEQGGRGLPTAPAGGVQAVFNSIFYPTLKNPALVSGYRAGVEQWLGMMRALPGGERNRLVNSEWWAYSPEPSAPGWWPVGGEEGSRQAVADVLGLIVHCQNADRWKFEALQYHAINVAEGRRPAAAGRPAEAKLPDCFFVSFGGKLWRTGRYFALRDISCRFANEYPALARCAVAGPASPAGPRDNSPGTQIQACAGLSRDRARLAVCLANLGDARRRVVVQLGRRAGATPHGVKIPPRLDPESPLVNLESIPFTSAAHDAVELELEGFCAALVELPLAQ